MKSILLFLLIALAFASTDFLTYNGPGPKPAKAPRPPVAKAAAAGGDSALKQLAAAFKGNALCLVRDGKHHLVVKDDKILAAAKAKAKALKPAVNVVSCHSFLAGFVSGAVQRLNGDLQKGAVKVKRLEKIKKLMKGLRDSVGAKADANSKKISALFKEVLGKSKGDVKKQRELAGLLSGKAKQFSGLAAKSKKFQKCWKVARCGSW
jgi:hypothetical protein